MTKYMISFPSGEMEIPEGEFDTVVEESHQVIRDMKAAGVYVFGGGVDESVPPVLVDAQGGVEEGTYPQTSRLEGGYTIIEVPSRDEAVRWASKVAAACRCRQELRAFGYDPES
ncbi:YciI family protein [Agrococcus sp. HG114]|uniref:YciI family protein n=1 Tax=Agrococcus sp. HG114 TaxID=2969757 RepID=UPI00215B4F57|nr:transcription initiation protein [Agrococcus sp. HG114]MCR8671674.1 transcription initiation protein [Agrococcus sp. HG114]